MLLYHSALRLDGEGENKMKNHFMGQDKGSVIKQKLRLWAEEEENKTFILYSPSARGVPPLP